LIPGFNGDGVLPHGRYQATIDEVEHRFVAPFVASATRKNIYDGWRKRREELLSIVDVEWEWVDGSFVTAKSNAGDIDVATFIDGTKLAALTIPQRQRVSDLTIGPHPRITFGCHSFLVVILDELHPQFSAYLQQCGYWDRQWSRDKTAPGKGYIEVREAR
jgi:hypothetical protein